MIDSYQHIVEQLNINKDKFFEYNSRFPDDKLIESIQIKNSKFYINLELFARLKKGI